MPKAHVHFAIYSHRVHEILSGVLRLTAAAIELAQPEMAMGDEWTHPVQLGERQRCSVMGRAGFGIEQVLMGRDVPEQTVGMSRKTGLAPRGCNRARAQAPCFIEPTEQQTRAAHRAVSPAVMLADPPRRLTLEELLALPEPGERLARLADLREEPSREGDRVGKAQNSVRRPSTAIACSISGYACAQSPLRR